MHVQFRTLLPLIDLCCEWLDEISTFFVSSIYKLHTQRREGLEFSLALNVLRTWKREGLEFSLALNVLRTWKIKLAS